LAWVIHKPDHSRRLRPRHALVRGMARRTPRASGDGRPDRGGARAARRAAPGDRHGGRVDPVDGVPRRSDGAPAHLLAALAGLLRARPRARAMDAPQSSAIAAYAAAPALDAPRAGARPHRRAPDRARP